MLTRQPADEYMILQSVERTTVTERVVERLIKLVASGSMRRGEKLPSGRELVERLNVGRLPIREVLGSVTLVGVLDTRPVSGTYAPKDLSNFIADQVEWSALLARHELLELYELRTLLEIRPAVLASERASADDIDRLERATQELQATGEDMEK